MPMRFSSLVAITSLAIAAACALPAQAALATATQELTVAADGSTPYKTVQSAVDAAPENATEPVVIHILPGTYKERVTVPKNKPFLTFHGDDAATTLITFSLGAPDKGPDGKNVGTSGSTIVLLNGDNFSADNLSFQNSFGNHGQAVAVRTTGDRLLFRHCRFLGFQDTLYPNGGRCYFDNCYIEGHVDYIFGRATAVFDHCEIRSLLAGNITAASTLEENPYGEVFLDCRLTAAPDVPPASVTLGRPWRPFAQTAFIRCDMGAHIKPVGWNNWGKESNEKTARYVEYGSTGPGADPAHRAPWAHQLTDEEARAYTVDHLLAGTDNWKPAPADATTAPAATQK